MKNTHQRIVKRRGKRFRPHLERLEYRIPFAADLNIELYSIESQELYWADSFHSPHENIVSELEFGDARLIQSGFDIARRDNVDRFFAEEIFAEQILWSQSAGGLAVGELRLDEMGFAALAFSELDSSASNIDRVMDSSLPFDDDAGSDFAVHDLELIDAPGEIFAGFQVNEIEAVANDALATEGLLADRLHAQEELFAVAPFESVPSDDFFEFAVIDDAPVFSSEAFITVVNLAPTAISFSPIGVASEGEDWLGTEPAEVIDSVADSPVDVDNRREIDSSIAPSATLSAESTLNIASVPFIESRITDGLVPLASHSHSITEFQARLSDPLHPVSKNHSDFTSLEMVKNSSSILMTDGLRDFGTEILHDRRDFGESQSTAASNRASQGPQWQVILNQARFDLAFANTDTASAFVAKASQLYVGGPIERLHGFEAFDIFGVWMDESPVTNSTVMDPGGLQAAEPSLFLSHGNPIAFAAITIGLGSYAASVFIKDRQRSRLPTSKSDQDQLIWGYLAFWSLDEVLDDTRPAIAKLSS